jgi:hypothetical protein
MTFSFMQKKNKKKYKKSADPPSRSLTQKNNKHQLRKGCGHLNFIVGYHGNREGSAKVASVNKRLFANRQSD